MFGRITGPLVLSLVFLVFLPRPSRAITIGFEPASSIHGVGDSFDVDVVVSGLASESQIVSAFDIDVLFDATVVRASTVAFGAALGDPEAFLPEAITALAIDPSAVHAAEVSLLSDADLFGLQLDTITLFRIRFEALSSGLSPLTFGAGVDDVKGRLADPPQNGIPSVLSLDAANGDVTVTPIRVPEPDLALLLVFSSAVLLSVRRG